MPVINSAPKSHANATTRLLFCCDQLDVLADLCDVLGRSIGSTVETEQHSDIWLTQIIRDEIRIVLGQIDYVVKNNRNIN